MLLSLAVALPSRNARFTPLWHNFACKLQNFIAIQDAVIRLMHLKIQTNKSVRGREKREEGLAKPRVHVVDIKKADNKTEVRLNAIKRKERFS